MDILESTTVRFNSRFSDTKFKCVLEDHITYLRNTSTDSIVLDDNLKTRWAGDLGGLLTVNGLKGDFHHITARINRLPSVCSDYSHLDVLMLPNESSIQSIIDRYRVDI